jgi:hypothetical protein
MFPLICSLDRFPLPMTKGWALQADLFDDNGGKLAVMPLRELARKGPQRFGPEVQNFSYSGFFFF